MKVVRSDRSEAVGLGVEYEQLRLRYDEEIETLWAALAPTRGPFFTTELLGEMGRAVDALGANPFWIADRGPLPVRYVVVSSTSEGRFSLGGDLSLFHRCISTNAREELREYARACVSVLHRWNSVLGARVTTIALVEGKALGGGFECALSCHYILASSNAQFGFPEALFNLFPGMGGYSFLARRVGFHRTEALIRRGNQYHAAAMKELGVVDEIFEQGKGRDSSEAFVRQHRANSVTRRAIERIRAVVSPITEEELNQVVDIWVDSAMALQPKDLRRLELLMQAQEAELNKALPQRLRVL